MSEEVNISVGGTLFVTKWSTLKRHQDTLLGGLSTSSKYYNEEKKHFFFDKNPEFFNTILDFYRNGHIHFPTNICGWIWRQELEFWQIPVQEISECCYPSYIKFENDKDATDYLKNAFAVQTAEYESKEVSCIVGIQQRIWLFLDEPASSMPARIFSLLYLTIVVCSALIPLLATNSNIREHVADLNMMLLGAQKRGLNLWINTDNPKEVLFFTTKLPQWLATTEMSLTVFFSIEFVLRVLTCPRKCTFIKNLCNILELVLFLSMWGRFAIRQYEEEMLENYNLMAFNSVLLSTLSLRLLRFFRITKQYSGLRILLMAVKESLKELCLLVLTFGIFVLIFSNLVFFAELREPTTFPDMLIGIWWAVVTMTTVGYGDVAPKSAQGRIVGSLCALSGLLLIAMPIAIIAGKFNDLYKKNEEIEQYEKLCRKTGSSSFLRKIKPGKVFTVTNKIQDTGTDISNSLAIKS